MQVCASCGHQNRPGVLFCENCGTSLTGQPAAGSTKGLTDIEPEISEQVISAGTDFVAAGSSLRLEIEGGPEPIIVKPKHELIFGRRDPATGAMPDIDLTPYAGYRMGVSRRHAALRATEDNHIDVWDLGSSNGTFLNGLRLNPHRPYRVHDGDHVRLGQMVIRVFFQPPLQGSATPEADTHPADATVPTSLAAALGAESGVPLSDLEAAPATTEVGEAIEAVINQMQADELTEPITEDDLAEVASAVQALLIADDEQESDEQESVEQPPAAEQPPEPEETPAAVTPAEDAAATTDSAEDVATPETEITDESSTPSNEHSNNARGAAADESAEAVSPAAESPAVAESPAEGESSAVANAATEAEVSAETETPSEAEAPDASGNPDESAPAAEAEPADTAESESEEQPATEADDTKTD